MRLRSNDLTGKSVYYYYYYYVLATDSLTALTERSVAELVRAESSVCSASSARQHIQPRQILTLSVNFAFCTDSFSLPSIGQI